MDLRFKILGRTALRYEDHQKFDEGWGQPKLRGMLAALLLHRGRAMSISELVEWVWPDGKEPDNPVGTFYSYASRIRPFLRRMTPTPNLVNLGGAYRLDVDPGEVDFHAFRATVESARAAGTRGDHANASQSLADALELWGDLPLADLHGERAAQWRQWSESNLWIPAQALLMQELSAVGRFDQVLHRLPELTAEHQANVSLVKRKIEALYGLGRGSEAKDFLRRMRKHLLSRGQHDEADDLLRFHDSLPRAPRAAAPAATTPPPDTPYLLCRDIPDFAGREDLLRRLDELTTDSAGEVVPGVVTVDGEAGVGKTTLAVHWAHAAASRFPGGVLSMDLGGFSAGPKVEVDKVVDEFLGALGFLAERIATTAGRTAKLRDLVANRCALVLLDNAYDSSHVDPLLDCLPGCVAVVTSRRKLSVLGRRGATNLTVAALSYQESKAWLAGRIGARVAGATDLLAELCGGNILVLRVVAQHVATSLHVPIEEIVNELRDSRKLLDLGDDGDGGPDSSVRAILSWSYRHLAADEQRVLRLVGLHPGPDVSVDIMAALAGQDRPLVERILGILVNAHLLTRMSRDRYRLHDLVRKYAAERISTQEHAVEREAAAERLLSYFLHTASNADRAVFPVQPEVDLLPLAPGVVPLSFSGSEAAMDWCTRERANIDAVIAFAGREGFHAYVPKLTNTTGEIFKRLGYNEDVIANLILGIKAARIIGDIEEEADVLNNLVHLALNRGDFEVAESYLDSAEKRYTATGYEIGLAVARHHRGRLCFERGEHVRGISLLQDSLTMLRRCAGVEGLEVFALHRIGEAHRRTRAYAEAASFCRDGLWLAERLGYANGQGRCLTELALIYAERGDIASARGYAARALTLHQRDRDRAGAGKTCNLLARLDLEGRASESAERHARMGLEICRAARDAEGEGVAHDLIARACLAQARHDEAAREWTLALAIFDDLRDHRAASVRTKLAEIPEVAPLVPETRTAPLSRQPRAPHKAQ